MSASIPTLTVKEYASHVRVTPRTVYEHLAKKTIPGAIKTVGGWRLPMPVGLLDGPYVGQRVEFGDARGEIVEIVPHGPTLQVIAIVKP